MATFAPKAWSVTDTGSLILAAGTRDSVVLDPHVGAGQAFLGVGVAAEVDKGIVLIAGRPVELTGPDACAALYAICDTADTSTGGIQES